MRNRTPWQRLTPRGLIAFWQCYRMQWRHLRRSHGTRRSAAHTAWYYGPIR